MFDERERALPAKLSRGTTVEIEVFGVIDEVEWPHPGRRAGTCLEGFEFNPDGMKLRA